ncbi:hypothetical protein RBB78_05445 [Tunturiibacter empetritectus]|uniref:hypothetical protein n=1 Tax=Tunturiibacter empetritectus TaxID=3069691 RepID=UPI003D9B67AC
MAKLLSLPALPTFRDPAGSIEVRPDGAYRSIRAPFDEEILAFLATPLASEMVAQGRLVASEVVSSPHAETLVLRHPRISFQSYPWEWSPGMWLVAAELTLTLCSDLIEQGWQLKDATPLNVLFQGRSRSLSMCFRSNAETRINRSGLRTASSFERFCCRCWLTPGWDGPCVPR